ncbi:MAG: hypothetical protein JNJ55_09615 [Betaproteobacteria bacterium]|nr:hypothetical protein [Betaproteobacteria bacterium]
MLNKHDELLPKDPKLQPLWLLWLYLVVGVAASAIAIQQRGFGTPMLLAIGGGFLMALDAEKPVTRRISNAAARLVQSG